MPPNIDEQIVEYHFPLLATSGYRITSPQTPAQEYNCIAWAAGIDDRWYWPTPGYWPPGIRCDVTIDAFIELYESFGYEVCADSLPVQGIEKVAIYVNSNGEPTHAAKLLSSGVWTSKLGSLNDIEHTHLEGLNGNHPAYGQASVFLSRPIVT